MCSRRLAILVRQIMPSTRAGRCARWRPSCRCWAGRSSRPRRRARTPAGRGRRTNGPASSRARWRRPSSSIHGTPCLSPPVTCFEHFSIYEYSASHLFFCDAFRNQKCPFFQIFVNKTIHHFEAYLSWLLTWVLIFWFKVKLNPNPGTFRKEVE